MDVKVVLLVNAAEAPTRSREGDAALDCCSSDYYTLFPKRVRKVPLGFSIAIPKGFVGLLSVRSGLSLKGVTLANGPGIIDSNYRGEVSALLLNAGSRNITIAKGERVVQLTLLELPAVEIKVVRSLDETNRGHCGFGSSGKF